MKKIVLIAGIVVITIVVLCINVSLNRNGQTGNIDLAQLTVTNQASAECTTSHGFGGGKCLMAGICVGDPGNNQCDFGW